MPDLRIPLDGPLDLDTIDGILGGGKMPFPSAPAPDIGPAPAAPAIGGTLPPIQGTSGMQQPAGPPGSSDYFAQQYAQEVGKPQPGLLGKIGGYALSFAAPRIASMLPQTPLGRIAEQQRTLGELRNAQAEERAQSQEQRAQRGEASEEQSRTSTESYQQSEEQRNAAQAEAAGKGEWKPVPETNFEINTLTGETRKMEGVQPLKPSEEKPAAGFSLTPGEKRYDAQGNLIASAPPKPEAADTARADAQMDRSYQFNSTQLEKERTPVEAAMSKISAATSNVNLQSPQADALLAPEILTISAGGQGSGLRMNEAEISRIVGGRTNWEALKAAINKWSTDPNHPQIPPDQRRQMVDILKAAAAKGQQKQSVLEWGEQNLIDAGDVKGHRTTVATVRKLLDAVDQGKTIERNKKTGELRIAPEQGQ